MEIDDLICPLCEQIYNDHKNIPRLLLCGHTYCQICLQKMLDSEKNLIYCQEENIEYKNIKSIDDLSKNISLIKLISIAHKRKKSEKSELISPFKPLDNLVK